MTSARRRLRWVAWLLLGAVLEGCPGAPELGPTPRSVSPDRGTEGVPVTIRIEGDRLGPIVFTDFGDERGSRVDSRFVARLGPYPLGDLRSSADGALTGVVPPDVPPGVYDLLVIDPEGRRGQLAGAFRVVAVTALGELVAGFRIEPFAPSQTARVPFPVTVTAIDAVGAIVTTFSGAVTLADTTGSVVPLRVGLFARGQWTGLIEIRGPHPSDVLTVTDDLGRTGASGPFAVVPSPPRRIAYRTPALTTTAGACAGPVELELQDAFGIATTAEAPIDVVVAAPAPLELFADAACAAPQGAARIAAGAGEVAIHLRATRAGALPLDASAATLDPARQVETVLAGPPASIAFATPSQTVNAGACSQVVELELRDAYGNAAAGPATLALTDETAAGVEFFSDAGCAAGTSTSSVPAGASRASFYFRGTVARAVTLAANGAGLPVASQQEIVEHEGRASRLVVVTPPRTVTAGGCSTEPITIQTQDSFGNPVSSAGAVQVAVSAPAGSGIALFADPACSLPISVLAIPAGQSLADLYFSGTAAAITPITVSASSLTPASQDVVVAAAAPKAIAFATAPQSVAAGGCSGAVRLELRDDFGNPSATATPTSISLTVSAPSAFALFADATCATPASAAAIGIGQASTRFWFRGTRAEQVDVGASASGLGGASQRETIQPGPASTLAFPGPAQSIQAGSCSAAATVELRDAFGNAATAGAATAIALAAVPPGLSFFSDAACGTASTSLPVAAGGTGATFFFAASAAASYAATASAPGLQPATQVESVSPAPPDRLAFSTAPQTVVAGACSGPLTLEARDPFGNPSAPAADAPISLAGSPAGVLFHAGAGCAGAPIGSIVLPAGTTAVTVSFAATTAGALDLTATTAGLAPAAQRETVAPAPPDRIAFVTPPPTVSAGQCSPALLVETRDPWGNASPVPADATVALEVAPASGTFLFYSDAACTAVATSVQIPAGASAASFHLLETNAGDRTVTVSPPSLAPASQAVRVLASGPTQLVFTSPPQSVTAGTCSPAFSVETRDGFGNGATVTSSTVVALDGGGLPLYSDPACGTATSSFTLAAGTGTAATGAVTFYARATVAGTYGATASAPGLASASQTVTIAAAPPDRLVFTTTPKTVDAGVCSGAVTLESRDAYANASAPAASTAVTLVAAPAAGFTFYAGGSCSGAPVTSFTLSGGASNLTLSFTGTSAGTVTLTATAAGYAGPAAVQAETIRAAPATQVLFLTGAQSVIAGLCSTQVVLEARDAWGNPSALPSGGTVLLTASPATGFAFHAGAGCSGAPVSSIAFAPGQSQTTFSFTGTVAGGVAVSVDALGLADPSAQLEAVTPSAPDRLAFLTAPQSVQAGACSQIATVEARDPYGNRSPVPSDTPVALTALPSAGFAFYGDAACATAPVASIILAAGQAVASFQFRGTVAQSVGVTAAATGFATPATQTESVTPGATASLTWDPVPSPQAVDVAFGVRIVALDAWGNATPAFTGSAGLSATPAGTSVECRSSCSSATSTNAFVAGVWTGSVAVAPAAVGVQLTATTGAASGTSSAFDVEAPASRSPPIARLSTATPVIVVGGSISFDASGSTDYETPAALLEASWDLAATSASAQSAAAPPSAPWSAFSTVKTATRTFGTAGVYYPRVAIRDTESGPGGPDVGYATTKVAVASSSGRICRVTTNAQTDDGASSCTGYLGSDGKLSLREAVRLLESMESPRYITFSGPMTISGFRTYDVNRSVQIIAPPGVVLDGQEILINGSDVGFSGLELSRLVRILVETGCKLTLSDVYVHDSGTVVVQGDAQLERVRFAACKSGSTPVDCVRFEMQALVSIAQSDFSGSGTNSGVYLSDHWTTNAPTWYPRIESTVFSGFGTAIRTASGRVGPTLAHCTFVGNGTAISGPGRRLISNAITGSTIQAVDCSSGAYPEADREKQLLFGNASEGCLATDLSNGSGTVVADPLYILPSARDYRIGWGSPARDAGQSAWIDAQAPLFDLNGPGPGLCFGVACDRGGRETW